MSTLDTMADKLNTLTNFAAWLSAGNGALVGDVTKDAALINTFLNSQSAAPRFVPYCSHCGSTNVTAGDFSTQPKPSPCPADWVQSTGPAWICAACGTYTSQ